MIRAWLLVGALVGASWAADPPEKKEDKPKPKTAFMMMAFVGDKATKTAGAEAVADAVARAQKQYDDLTKSQPGLKPEEKSKLQDQVVEQNAPAINSAMDGTDAGVSPDQVRQLNDAVAEFNLAAGRPSDALRYSQNALNQDASDRQALVSHSAANLSLNRADAAFADADRAAKLAPDDANALRARALASYQLHDYNRAREDAERTLALVPNDPTAYAVLQLATAKVPKVKLDGIQGALAGDVRREYHGMVQQMNQVEERAAKPEAAPEEPKPAGAEQLVRSASTKISLKDYFGAISDADRAIAADPDDEPAYFYRAAASNLVGRYGDAASDATRALMIDPHDAHAHDTRAWAYNNLGRYRDAIADSMHSLEIDPKNPYAFWNLGYAHEHEGDLSAMLSDLKSAASLNPQFESAYREAAQRHGLDPEPVGRGAYRQRRRTAEEERRRSFAVVVLSSLIGGLLIALGFIHLYGAAKEESARAQPGKSAPEAPLPQLGGGYSLGQKLGTGGMGVVYEAFDKALQRPVAVKVMRPELGMDAQARERFLQEARTVAALHHPAIVDIHAVVEDKDALCLIFERIEGRTLEEILRERGRVSLQEARALLKPVCQGLDFAHRHGVVHRDLKPGNIMVTTGGQVKLMDFGISRPERVVKDPLTPAEHATAHGTPYYMAPEQERGEVRRESDIFSLGACLYEMVTGQRPYPAPFSLGAKASREYIRASIIVPGLPHELDDLLDWALHPDPSQRIRAAGDFWHLLDKIKLPQGAVA